MELIRVGSVKDLKKTVDRIEIIVDECRYTLTESFGRLEITSSHDSGSLNVRPGYSNVISLGVERK